MSVPPSVFIGTPGSGLCQAFRSSLGRPRECQDASYSLVSTPIIDDTRVTLFCICSGIRSVLTVRVKHSHRGCRSLVRKILPMFLL